MFKSSSEAQQFRDGLKKLVIASQSAKPATIYNSAKRLLDRSDGYDGHSLEELIAHIVKAKNRKPPSKKAKSSSSKRSNSKALVSEIVNALKNAEKNEKEFNTILNKFDKTCVAAALRSAAAEYAASGMPKNKSEALRLFKTERASRLRTKLKHDESANARPW